MKNFTISHNKPTTFWQKFAAVIIWLLVWFIASNIIKQEMLLASPVSVVKRLAELAVTAGFWQSIFFSISKILAGFLLAFILGILLAALAYRFNCIYIFLQPLMGILKAAPAASYIILCLIFISSKHISFVTSFIMGLPIIYTNVLQGLYSTDKKLLEMAYIFRVGIVKRILYIYISQIIPFLISACSLAVGLCWKSGIAAEIIGMTKNSIGEHMYQAKIFVETPTVLAWTVVVVIISLIFEKLFLALFKNLTYAIEKK